MESIGTFGVWVHRGVLENCEVWVHWYSWNIGSKGIFESMGTLLLWVYRDYEYIRIKGILGVLVDLTYIESMGIIPNRRKGRSGVLVHWECM